MVSFIQGVRTNPILWKGRLVRRFPNIWQTVAAGLGTALVIFFVKQWLDELTLFSHPLDNVKFTLPLTVFTLYVGLRAAQITVHSAHHLDLLRLTTLGERRVVQGYLLSAVYRMRVMLAVMSGWSVALIYDDFAYPYGSLYRLYSYWVDGARSVGGVIYSLKLLIIPRGIMSLLRGLPPRMHDGFLIGSETTLPASGQILLRGGLVALAIVVGVGLGLRLKQPTNAVVATVTALGLIEVVYFFAVRWPMVLFLRNKLGMFRWVRHYPSNYWALYFLALSLIPIIIALVAARRLRLGALR